MGDVSMHQTGRWRQYNLKDAERSECNVTDARNFNNDFENDTSHQEPLLLYLHCVRHHCERVVAV